VGLSCAARKAACCILPCAGSLCPSHPGCWAGLWGGAAEPALLTATAALCRTGSIWGRVPGPPRAKLLLAAPSPAAAASHGAGVPLRLPAATSAPALWHSARMATRTRMRRWMMARRRRSRGSSRLSQRRGRSVGRWMLAWRPPPLPLPPRVRGRRRVRRRRRRLRRWSPALRLRRSRASAAGASGWTPSCARRCRRRRKVGGGRWGGAGRARGWSAPHQQERLMGCASLVPWQALPASSAWHQASLYPCSAWLQRKSNRMRMAAPRRSSSRQQQQQQRWPRPARQQWLQHSCHRLADGTRQLRRLLRQQASPWGLQLLPPLNVPAGLAPAASSRLWQRRRPTTPQPPRRRSPSWLPGPPPLQACSP
jgi:hypothetical protein